MSEKVYLVPYIDGNGDHVAKDSTMQTVRNALTLIAKAKGASTVTTLRNIQRNVRGGFGANLYPIGYKIVTNHSVYGNITWVVVGHNQINSATGKEYTMTLLAKDCLANIQFDEFEAIYARAETSALAPGNYYFTLNNVDYYFTTTVSIPVGGQLVKSAGSEYAPSQLKSYASPLSTTVLETISCSTTAIEGATSLGTSGSGNVNHHQRTWYGSNNYKESAIRQFLNSDLAAGEVWEPKTKFDRPPSWQTTLAGFKAGLPQEFLNVIDYAQVKCSANGTYESPDSTTTVSTSYILNDQFFLPSRMEVFGSSDDITDGSVVMSYYNGASAYDRIKMQGASPWYWWLRTPTRWDALNGRLVSTDGSLGGDYALRSNGCVPACIIA